MKAWLLWNMTCDQRKPLKWVSILTGVVLLFVLWPKRTFEMGFHSHWSCFTLRSVTKENLWNGFPSSLELFYPSFCDQIKPLKWVSILTGVVLLFVLWPKKTFEMGFHPHWSCFTLRSMTKENLWNGFPFSLELFYSSFCDQRKPLKWVSILTGVVLFLFRVLLELWTGLENIKWKKKNTWERKHTLMTIVNGLLIFDGTVFIWELKNFVFVILNIPWK